METIRTYKSVTPQADCESYRLHTRYDNSGRVLNWPDVGDRVCASSDGVLRGEMMNTYFEEDNNK